jgi:hypothetical protein
MPVGIPGRSGEQNRAVLRGLSVVFAAETGYKRLDAPYLRPSGAERLAARVYDEAVRREEPWR